MTNAADADVSLFTTSAPAPNMNALYGLSVGAGVILSVASSSRFVGASSAAPFRPTFQPKSIAFSIWSVLFSFGIVFALRVGTDAAPVNASLATASILYATSFLATAAWAPLFAYARY